MISSLQEKINKYLKIGLCEYKPILTAQEISTLRQRLENEFKKKLNPTELGLEQIDDNFLKDQLLKTIFHKEVMKFVENISITVFGESTKIIVLPKLYVMKNYLPNPYNGNFGWHVDCGGEMKHEFCKKRFIDMLKNEKDRKVEISSISVPKKSSNFIEIKAEAISNEIASREILRVVDYIKNKHQKILNDVKNRRELEIKNINTKIDNIKSKEIKLLSEKIDIQQANLNDYKLQLNTIGKNIKDIENSNPALTALKLMEKRDLSSFILELNLQLMDMRNQKDELETTSINQLLEKKQLVESMMLPHNYKNSEVIGRVITNDYPIKPKKKLIVAVAFIAGFILSIFLVFIMNAFRKDDDKASA